MSKQTAQNANLVGDCLILVIASAVATRSPSGWHWMVMPGMAMGSIFVWMLGGRVLRHYDVWNGRGIAGDVVLTTLLLGAMLAVMGALRWVVPRMRRGATWSGSPSSLSLSFSGFA